MAAPQSSFGNPNSIVDSTKCLRRSSLGYSGGKRYPFQIRVMGFRSRQRYGQTNVNWPACALYHLELLGRPPRIAPHMYISERVRTSSKRELSLLNMRDALFTGSLFRHLSTRGTSSAKICACAVVRARPSLSDDRLHSGKPLSGGRRDNAMYLCGSCGRFAT